MPWVRLDDGFPQHPKVVTTGPLGLALQVAGLCYCSRYLTDGFIPQAAVPSLLDFSEEELTLNLQEGGGLCLLTVERLVSAGVWAIAPGGYRVHDYLHYQPSKEQVLRNRESNNARQSRYRNPSVTPLLTPVSRKSNSNVTGMSQAPRTRTHTPYSTPVSPYGETSPLKGTRQGRGITSEFIEKVALEWSLRLGGEEAVREIVQEAMNHKAMDKRKDKQLYILGWLRRDAERRAQGGSNGLSQGHPGKVPDPALAKY